MDNDSGHSLWDPAKHDLNPITKKHDRIKEKVQMVTLDSVIDFIPKLIKIDTEGCEFMVLKGAENILKQYKPYVVSEIHTMGLNEMGSSAKELYEYMTSLGYCCINLSTNKEINLTTDSFPFVVFNVLFKPCNH